MALIKCPECGKAISDKAPTCPNCGYPINETTKSPDHSKSFQGTSLLTEKHDQLHVAAGKALNIMQSGIQATIEKAKDSYHATKQIGPVQIDEAHQVFRINGIVPVNGKKDGIGKTMFRGMMAVSTMGMSVAAEKLIGTGNKQKVGNKEWFDFPDLINYELLEDDSLVTSGGVGQALVGGALFGGFGAVAGGITAKRSKKRKVESLYIKATINNFSSPCIMIPLITKPTKTDSKEYQTAFNLAHQILAAFDVITHNK